MTAKSLALLAAFALSAAAGAQSWSRAYEAGLTAARAGKWALARESFRQAADVRPEDRSGTTVLPGPATERKLWRNGASYSPNFLAAYSLYRQAVGTVDPAEASKMLRSAAGEIETLLDKGQNSAEAFFYLDVIYTRLEDPAKRRTVAARLTKLDKKPDFKVDDEIVAPEELAALQAQSAGPANPGTPGGTIPTPGGSNPPQIFGPGPLVGQTNPAVNANVAPLKNKFALVIGQNGSRIPGGLIPFAVDDAEKIRGALVDFAGYPTENVTLLRNATAAEMKTAALQLASRMPDEGATITIFFSGAGVNLDGKDYLAGADSESAGDVSSMLGKTELFDLFVRRGAQIFSFFEANRPGDLSGPYFGKEVVRIGSVSEVQGTIAGDIVTAIYRKGQAVGLFANALAKSFADVRSNQIPIHNFMTEKVIILMRRGDTGTTGSGARQICTLPRYSNLAADAKL